MVRFFIILLSVSLLFACHSKSSLPNATVQLIPLSPFQYEFARGDGRYRIDYFFVEQADIHDAHFRASLLTALKQAKSQVQASYDTYSIYVYQQNDEINRNFAGNHSDLRGKRFNALVSYTRWEHGTMDIAYMIHENNVVFDLIENKAEDPAWEFE